MALVAGVIFVLLAVVAILAYGGTPHGGPTTTCGPIDIGGKSFTLQTDCRYVSAAEVGIIIVFLLLAFFSLLAARPRR